MHHARQLGFFPSGSKRTLVDDATGWIYYIPDAVTGERAAAWFASLRDSIEWQSERRPMYDRIVDVPRLTAHFAPGDKLPFVLVQAKEVAERLTHVHYNSVGLNYYRDGRDSVAWHNDHLDDMPPQPTIALLSLGATRRMQVRTKRRPRVMHGIDLDPGSLFVMSGRSQEFWEHTIAKSARPVDARVSVAFRPRMFGNASQHGQAEA